MPTFDKWTGKFFSGVGLFILDKDINGNPSTFLFRHPTHKIYSILGGPTNDNSLEINQLCANKVRELSSNLVNINTDILKNTPIFDLRLEDGMFYRIYLLTLKKSINLTSDLLIKNQNNIKKNLNSNANKISNWMFCDKILRITIEDLLNPKSDNNIAPSLNELINLKSEHEITNNQTLSKYITMYEPIRNLKISKNKLNENSGSFSNTTSWVIRKKRGNSKSKLRKSRKRNRDKSQAKKK